MTPEVKKEYQSFFLESVAGQHFVEHLQKLIDIQHRSAENEPELARDYVQRAKGIREVISHIQSVTAKPKKGRVKS